MKLRKISLQGFVCLHRGQLGRAILKLALNKAPFSKEVYVIEDDTASVSARDKPDNALETAKFNILPSL